MDGKPDNISFMIKRIKVHTQDALEDPTYRFPGNYGVEKFLEIFSGWISCSDSSDLPSISLLEEDYDAFCLAYMFTYRDFEGGTLGLAWTGDLKNAGGVCEKNGVSIIDQSWLIIATSCYWFLQKNFKCILLDFFTVFEEKAKHKK